jgi:hypothetical protein
MLILPSNATHMKKNPLTEKARKLLYLAPLAQELELCNEGIVCLSGGTVESGESGTQDYNRQDGQEW